MHQTIDWKIERLKKRMKGWKIERLKDWKMKKINNWKEQGKDGFYWDNNVFFFCFYSMHPFLAIGTVNEGTGASRRVPFLAISTVNEGTGASRRVPFLAISTVNEGTGASRRMAVQHWNHCMQQFCNLLK